MRILPLLLFFAFAGFFASYLAEPSAPGDVLYAVKSRVSEPVRAMFSLTTESRIMRNEQYAERRIEESERLAAENRLGIGIASDLVRDFERYARTARTAIDAMMVQSPVRAAELNVGLAARLVAHEEILEAMMDESQAWRASLPGIAAAVSRHREGAAPPDLYAIGKKATEQQLFAMARRALEVRKEAESVAREASTKTGASGIDPSSLAERFVNHANDLLDTSQREYQTASQRVDASSAETAYVALATSLSAAVQAQSYAQAAIDITSVGSQISSEAAVTEELW